MLVHRFKSRLTAALRYFSRYAAIVPALPGGALIFASLWTLRHHQWFAAYAHRLLAVVWHSEHTS